MSRHEKVNTQDVECIKKMVPAVLRTAYQFGSECYWAMREKGEQMPIELMDRLIAITDELFREEVKQNG